MRYWSENPGEEQSMNGPRRNDTNETRLGRDAGSQFDDQSDDVPQTIQPRLYNSRLSALLRERYPHPLLCSPLGVIDVMPDHPHEGGCRIPSSYTAKDHLGKDEYPALFYLPDIGLDDIDELRPLDILPTTFPLNRVAPEVISTSFVQAGNDASGQKAATEAHSFGGICAYDGHKVGIGRVVTDATWHHFVNVNLIGELGNNDPAGSPEHYTKDRDFIFQKRGFMSTPSGRAALDKIKHYYVNIGVWLAPPAKQKCFTTRLIVIAFKQHRVHEAAMLNPDIKADLVDLQTLASIGTHARDVIGKAAGQCRKLQVVLEKIQTIMPEWAIRIDPWSQARIDSTQLPFVNLDPVFNVAVGAGMLAVRDKIGSEDAEFTEKLESEIESAFEGGFRKGLQDGMQSFKSNAAFWSRFGSEKQAAGKSYFVEGTVTNESGKPLSGLTILAVDLDFTAENPLGKPVQTDKQGYYRISYTEADFIIDGKESGGADIKVYVYRQDELLKEVGPLKNSPQEVRVDIQL